MVYLFHISHDRIFLSVDETFQHDTNRHVDVIFVYVFTKMHSRMRFSHSNHGLDVSHCDWDTTSDLLEKMEWNDVSTTWKTKFQIELLKLINNMETKLII